MLRYDNASRKCLEKEMLALLMQMPAENDQPYSFFGDFPGWKSLPTFPKTQSQQGTGKNSDIRPNLNKHHKVAKTS